MAPAEVADSTQANACLELRLAIECLAYQEEEPAQRSKNVEMLGEDRRAFN